MAAFWTSTYPPSEGWRMSYSGDDPKRAEEIADKLRKEGKETVVTRHMTKSLAMRSYMEYATLYREKGNE